MQQEINHTMLPISNQVKINDLFWSYYIKLIKDVVIPYQWKALNDQLPDVEKSSAIKNFKIVAGEEEGEFYGMVFQDSDVAKWLEAVGGLLAIQPDDELEKMADDVIELIEKAQHPDGYLNTYYTIKEPENRWTNLCECHELYCAGHLIEAAVSYYQATGKRKILDIVIKFADYINDTFGPEEKKIQGYDGHQEIELALLRLYEVTQDEKYLALSRFFLEERGKSDPHFYQVEVDKRGPTYHWGSGGVNNPAYSQAHASIYEQEVAVGHSVRFVYMCTGMAHLAALTGDDELYAASKRLWDNMVNKQMYITGAIGSQRLSEAFTFDYDLPNDLIYGETCASIGIMFFARRMLAYRPEAHFADVMERALYNTVLAGIARDGNSFFYVNPLEVHPKACATHIAYEHVKPVRQKWFGCACCPPNVARLLASLNEYIYTVYEDTVYTNLYISGDATLNVSGQTIKLTQESRLPWEGYVAFTISSNVFANIALRIPDWCDMFEVKLNGVTIQALKNAQGYVVFENTWQIGDLIELTLNMPISRMKGHPMIRQLAGKVALQRGPLVYCLEEIDNGAILNQLKLPKNAQLKVSKDSSFIDDMLIITAKGLRETTKDWGQALYQPSKEIPLQMVELTFIPYFAWANRGENEMQVWIRED